MKYFKYLFLIIFFIIYNNIYAQNVNRFVPTHIVIDDSADGLQLTAYEKNNEKSKRLINLYLGETLELIETVSLEGIVWHKMKTQSNVSGWCKDGHFMDIRDIDLSQISMNKINIKNINTANQKNEILKNKLSNEYGRFSYKYGMNTVNISYYYKNYNYKRKIFRTPEEFPDFYFMDRFLINEIYIYKNLARLPGFYFCVNEHINIVNGINVIDSFIFCQFVSDDFQLNRIVNISTNDYYIEIKIELNKTKTSPEKYEMKKEIIAEAPVYFKQEENGDYSWDVRNNGYIRFGEDLINDKHPSALAVQWYNETEEILNRIKIE